MSASPDFPLPPNPYTRGPIRKPEHLAGRGREIRTIRYYLGLTASGQSPHLALIGQRGIGKTSLLNKAEAISVDLKLTPVRLDLNEQKARSAGEFWHDFYATLILALAKAGCWGGLGGPIYADLFKMMHARQQPTSVDKIVLQTPFAFACHRGELSTFSCVDALVIHDFQSCVEELHDRGYSGITLLIDEADCLRINVPLLQMLRNIFQSVQSFSLILAGTEAIFPSISEVFSPVPRQFHRIDVKPFAHLSDTIDLIMKPLKAQKTKETAPDSDSMHDLHDLCGGDPSEVQLYCHHMYRMVEEGRASKMALLPQVFREVLREYRASAPANFETVMNSIDNLQDKYLFGSAFLSRRNVSCDENTQIETLARTLNKNATLSPEERNEVAWEIKQAYQALFKAGIIEDDNHMHLIGTPLTAGYWKSFVEVEKDKRWTWSDKSFGVFLQDIIASEITKALRAHGYLRMSTTDEAFSALQALRRGEAFPDFSEGFAGMIFIGMMAHFEKDKISGAIIDIDFQMESPDGRQIFRCRCMEGKESPGNMESVEEWTRTKLDLLSSSGIVLSVTNFSKWILPTNNELHRLARIVESELPEAIFGPTEVEIAIAKFGEGQIDECVQIFSVLLKDKHEPVLANNLGFCELLLGRFEDGLQHVESALAISYDPLFELNKGLALFLTGKKDLGIDSLLHALDWVDQNKKNKYSDDNPLYVLLLAPDSNTVRPIPEVPLLATLLMNLCLMGKLTKEDLQSKMEKAFPTSHKSLLLLLESET